MRENTRWEVDDPMSTPTLTRRISSSSSRLRPMLLKNMRPPELSLIAGSLVVRALVPFGLHAVGHPVLPEQRLVLLADERVFHGIGDGRAALVDVDGGVVGVLLARGPGIAARVVGAEPGREPEGVFGHAEVLVIPAGAAGCRGDHAH